MKWFTALMVFAACSAQANGYKNEVMEVTCEGAKDGFKLSVNMLGSRDSKQLEVTSIDLSYTAMVWKNPKFVNNFEQEFRVEESYTTVKGTAVLTKGRQSAYSINYPDWFWAVDYSQFGGEIELESGVVRGKAKLSCKAIVRSSEVKYSDRY
ncbi:MAG: hypothetical protein AB7O96_08855 [Pseudobdellovibrionaceae bacterium]